MIRYSWSLSISGNDFSPKELMQIKHEALDILNPIEKGEFAENGRFKGKKHEYGSCVLAGGEDFQVFLTNAFLLIAEYEKRIPKIEDKKLTLNVIYNGQCNFELSCEILKLLYDNNMKISITCYSE